MSHRLPAWTWWTYQLSISSAVQDQVLRLQVPVDDAFGMQVSECFNHAASVEPSGGVIKRTSATNRDGENYQCIWNLETISYQVNFSLNTLKCPFKIQT